MESLQAEFNYRKPLKDNEEKPAFGLTEDDGSMSDHKSFTKQVPGE